MKTDKQKLFIIRNPKFVKTAQIMMNAANQQNVRIITYFGGNLSKEMFLKMESKKGKEIYQLRFSKAESPFALGKEYLNMRQARARGEMQMDLQAKFNNNYIKYNKN